MAAPTTPAHLVRQDTAIATPATRDDGANQTLSVDDSDAGESSTAWGRLVSLATDVQPHLDLTDSRVTIGRNATCSIVLTNQPFISGLHATLELSADRAGAVLTDSSSNGVLVNGQRIAKGVPVAVRPGDEIVLGKSKADRTKHLAFLLQLTQPTTPIRLRTHASTDGVAVAGEPAAKRKADNKVDDDDDDDDDEKFEESLGCSICRDVIHDCISVLPCLHSFCAGCYSMWRAQSRECPDCRTPVTALQRNFTINNLVEAFLLKHPHKKRAAADLAQLDKQNTIKPAELAGHRPAHRPHHHHHHGIGTDDEDEEEDEDDEDGSDHDSDEDDDRDLCRHCLGPHAGPDGILFACPAAGAVHLHCTCCDTPMPDRRPDAVAETQHCDGCHRPFCNLYFARENGCACANGDVRQGCLTTLGDRSWPARAFDRCILNASVESQFFKDYMQSQNMTPDAFFREALGLIASGQFTSTAVPGANAAMRACSNCATKVFNDVAYQKRVAVAAQMPAAVTSRPDCHWGRNCRTHTHNDRHAQNFNHVCEQTRF